MPLKIQHPKTNAKHPNKLIIIQGRCDNAAKVDGVLVNTANGQTIGGGQKLTNKPNQWGYLYKNLANGDYKFTITQTNSPVVMASVDFKVDLKPPPPSGTPPTVVAPADADEVATIFYPYGTSTQVISAITFFGGGNTTNGTVTQQPDTDGNWTGQVDGIDNFPSGSGNPYQLTVSNAGGPKTVNNLTIA